jgi:death-on-curing family protein
MSELDFKFLASNQIIAIHDYAIRNDGGRSGLLDRNALESAVLAPRKTAAELAVDAFDLAAVYAYTLARTRPFVEGNERTALTAALVFLGLNKYSEHSFRQDDLEKAMRYLTNREITCVQWAEYLRDGFDGLLGSWVDDPDGQPD